MIKNFEEWNISAKRGCRHIFAAQKCGCVGGTFVKVPPPINAVSYASGDQAIVVMSASSARLASRREYCTTIGSLDSTRIA